MKKLVFALFCSSLFFISNITNASVLINEIMYDPPGNDTNREWIEVSNDSNASVDFSGYKFYENETNHGLTIYQGDSNVPAGGYFIIVSNPVSFLEDYPSFSGVIFDSSFSLNNTGEELILKDENLNSVDTVTYNSSQGGNDNGNSLQKTSNSWIEALPTPGAVNEDISNEPPSGDDGGGGGGSSSNNSSSEKEEVKKEIIKNPTIKAKILTNALAFVGEPHEMKVKILGYSNEDIVLGKVYWNFGDGSSLEQINNFENFSHTYYYPGEYPVLLEYREGPFSVEPEATDKITIKVIPTTVVISKIGDSKDFFVELTNDANNDIDISNWSLRAGGKQFFLPKNSVILAKRKMTLSSRITGFSFGDQYNLKLFSATGDLISDYNNKFSSFAGTANPSVTKKQISKNLPEDEISQNVSNRQNEENRVLGNNLLGSVIESNPLSEGENKNFYLYFGLFLVLLLISGGTIYFIRQRKTKGADGSDFEILDE
jgi:hypothetical protein